MTYSKPSNRILGLVAITVVATMIITTTHVFATEETHSESEILTNAQQSLLAQLGEEGKERLDINAVFVDPRIPALVVGINHDAALPIDHYRSEIKQLVSDDVKVNVDYGRFIESTCTDNKSQCSPLTGSLEIESQYNSTHTGAGTIAIADTDTSDRKGIVISGHVANPSNSGTDIGQDSLSRTVADEVTNPSGERYCDCAFAEIRKDAWGGYLYSTDEDAIWESSNSYYTIASKVDSSSTPGGTDVRFIGITSGEVQGEVVTVNAVIDSPSYGTLNGQVFADFVTQSGDSGGPVFSVPVSGDVDFYGIIAGNYEIGGTTYGVYSPWEHIEDELNLQ